jgi:hypothetical protein
VLRGGAFRCAPPFLGVADSRKAVGWERTNEPTLRASGQLQMVNAYSHWLTGVIGSRQCSSRCLHGQKSSLLFADVSTAFTTRMVASAGA